MISLILILVSILFEFFSFLSVILFQNSMCKEVCVCVCVAVNNR